MFTIPKLKAGKQPFQVNTQNNKHDLPFFTVKCMPLWIISQHYQEELTGAHKLSYVTDSAFNGEFSVFL